MNEETKRIIKVVLIVIIMIIGIKFIQGIQDKNSISKDLKKRGYNDEEITILLENLNEEEIKNISFKEYDGFLPKLISHKYYIKDNHQKYIEYSKDNNNLDEVISIINVKADKDWYTFTTQIEDFSNSMLVNKYYFLPADYNPNDIVSIKNWYAYDNQSIKKEVYDQYVKMHNAASNQGLRLIVETSYRTFEQQENIYRYSGDLAARPGFSEHQTGLALDIKTDKVSDSNFESSEEFTWLKNNAYKYGFILRYPKGKEKITGIKYEPWHYRYLGVDLATKVHDSGLTYEEYYAYYCEYKKEC